MGCPSSKLFWTREGNVQPCSSCCAWLLLISLFNHSIVIKPHCNYLSTKSLPSLQSTASTRGPWVLTKPGEGQQRRSRRRRKAGEVAVPRAVPRPGSLLTCARRATAWPPAPGTSTFPPGPGCWSQTCGWARWSPGVESRCPPRRRPRRCAGSRRWRCRCKREHPQSARPREQHRACRQGTCTAARSERTLVTPTCPQRSPGILLPWPRGDRETPNLTAKRSSSSTGKTWQWLKHTKIYKGFTISWSRKQYFSVGENLFVIMMTRFQR